MAFNLNGWPEWMVWLVGLSLPLLLLLVYTLLTLAGRAERKVSNPEQQHWRQKSIIINPLSLACWLVETQTAPESLQWLVTLA